MTSPITAIAALTSGSGISPISATNSSIALDGASSSSGANFASVLGKGLDSLQSSQSTADSLAVKAATGDLADISSYTIAASQASLATNLATTLRTKAVDAFNQIMGMQA